jgi:lysozyme family protein
MPNFDLAMKKLRKWEGGLSNHLDDKGGKTYCGITKRNFPNWPGWRYVDTLTHTAHMVEMKRLVEELYHKEFWLSVWGGKLPTQDLADALLSFAVNLGPRQAIKLAQEVLGLKADGSMGTETLKALQLRGGSQIYLNKYLDRVGKFYLDLAKKDPSQKVFEKGWQNRVEDYRPKAD